MISSKPDACDTHDDIDILQSPAYPLGYMTCQIQVLQHMAAKAPLMCLTIE